MNLGRTVAVMVLAGVASACVSGGGNYPPAAQCPQPRFTGRAPQPLYERINPVPPTRHNIDAGRHLYHKGAQPPCANCHGVAGDGQGPLASQFDPAPRNFACTETINGIPDGQLLWIVRNGSPGTSMPGFPALSMTESWQVVLYLRELSQ